MDVRSWDGTLSATDFCVAARAFADKWKRVNPTSTPWLWVPSPKRPFLCQAVDGYLSLDSMCILGSTEDSVNDASLSEDEKQEEEVVDNATLVQSSRYHEEHFYDFHIVYCPSYRVPVLYFRGYCSDGRPLALNEIEKDLPSCSAKALLESKWTFITQEEHPYLNRPWYKLHPCGTGKWMKLLFLDAALAGKGLDIELYLVSWCSVVGQVVGLRIPLEMLNVI
uniref:Ubiquitin-like-conjugating enzyme ATG10 n=1 Tax=Rhizophora mucronata TaxID=61149 RepID=A0A2P2JKW9_RHIMU